MLLAVAVASPRTMSLPEHTMRLKGPVTTIDSIYGAGDARRFFQWVHGFLVVGCRGEN